MPYYAWIAWRYLRARVRQTALTISGVALGVAIVTIMQSYMGGFLDFFITRALQSTPDVTVTQTQQGLPNPAGPVRRALRDVTNPLIVVEQLPIPEETEELDNPRGAEELIVNIPGVRAIAPFVSGGGLIVNGDVREPVNFVGIRPLQETRVTDFEARMVRGTAGDLAQRANGIILGYVLALNVSAEVGDRVTVISNEGISRRFSVVGIYYAQLDEIDESRAFLNLPQAQQLLGTRGVSGLGVATATLEDAVPVARQIEARTDYTAQTWREINSGILDLFTTISLIIYLVVGLTMLVAGFGIANTLILTVNEKMRDIGVLKALGVPATRITLLFVIFGLLIGVLGVALGEVLGFIGVKAMASTPIPLSTDEAGRPIPIETFPMLQAPRVYIVSGIFGLLISLASSVLPSLRAAKADPLVVIRGAE